MAAQLTRGAVDAMHKGQQIRSPLVQVIDVKKILGPSGQATTPERYRLVISDGEHFQQAMLATQLNDLVNDGRLQPKCVVRLNEYICNTVHGRRIVIVLSVELTGPPLSHTIGAPQNIEEASAATASGSAPAMTSAPARPAPPPQRQQQQARPFQSNTPSSRAPSSAPALPEGVIPIKGLNPYQNRWTIKARVTAKSEKRSFTAKSTGNSSNLFSVDLLDAYGGEIRCTFFGEAAEQWSEVMAVGDVYLIGRGTVKYANKRFSNLKNDYEISIDRNGLVEQQDDDPSIPFFRFSFVDIADLPQHNKDETIDIIGAVISVGDVATINTKAGNALQKRVIYVGDSSNAQVEITLWGDQADSWSAVPGSVLLFKGVKISDFNNRSLSVLRTSKVESEPRIPEADRVRQWYATYGHGDIHSVSQNDFRRGGGGGGDGGFGGGAGGARWDDTRKTFADVKHETQNGNTYFTLRATITEIKHSRDHPPWYEACPTEKCNKKVTLVNGAYHCSKCDATHENYVPRYILSINANDHTGSSWLTCFNDSAPAVLNKSAEQLHQMLNEPGGAGLAQYESVFEEALFKTYNLRVRASEGYESKLKLNVVKATPLDYAKESKILIDAIAKHIPV